MSDRDYAIALQLQEQYDAEKRKMSKCAPSPSTSKVEPVNLGNSELEFTDPTPNVHNLFIQFNKRFFGGSLSSVAVRWSKRMYSCAGLCRYEGRGGFCEIALSEPLLKLRPRKNLIETLLHEMIHAYLFIVEKDRDREGHGPNFQLHMHRINKEANVNITIYHSFTEEVRLYQTHWWRCDGVCRNNRPFFGIVRRSSNRAPGPNDYWWAKHQAVCGGTFIKTKEPEKKLPPPKKPIKAKPDIRNYFTPNKRNDPEMSTELTPPFKRAKLDDTVEIIKDDVICSTPKISNSQDSVAAAVRNHWATKYATKTDVKKDVKPDPISTTETFQTPKSFRIKEEVSDVSLNVSGVSQTTPRSYRRILTELYGDDFPITPETFKVNKVSKQLSECPLCNKAVFHLQDHLPKCLDGNEFNNNDFDLPNTSAGKIEPIDKKPSIVDLTAVLIPDVKPNVQNIDLTNLDADIKPTLSQITDGKPLEIDLTLLDDDDTKQCPICNAQISAHIFHIHIEDCINRTMKDESEDFESNPTAESITNLDNDDEWTNTEPKSQPEFVVPCPYCLTLIDESAMNAHLEKCL